MKTQVFENTQSLNILNNEELNNQVYNPIEQNLALTVRKEYRLTVVKNITKTTLRMSWKTLAYVAFLMLANVII